MATVREQLFDSALSIFRKPSTVFSEAVQNPNCVNSEEDVEALYKEAERFVEVEENRVRLLRHEVLLWMTQLREAYRAGELKEW